MQVKKIILFSLLLIIHCTQLAAVELDSKLENNLFLSRIIYREADYSLCLLGGSDIKSSQSIVDFSFENSFILAGRMKRLGIWRELYNPLVSSANSDLFTEAEGFQKNFSFSKNGLYGLYLEQGKSTGIGILYSGNLWLGGNYTFNIDPLLVTVFSSLTEPNLSSTDEWTSSHSFLPKTDLFHIGVHPIFKWDNFEFDYLAALSGSPVYKAGSYNRLVLELSGPALSIKALGGIASTDFISTDGKLVKNRYLLGMWFQLQFNKDCEISVKCEYSEEQQTVIPMAYIPTSGNASVKLKYDNSKFICSTEFSQKFNFDGYGTGYVENNFDGRIGMAGQVSAYFLYGFSSDFDSLIERKFELNAGSNIRKTDVELVLKHSEKIFEPVDQNTFRLRVDHELGAGSIYFTIELGNEWELGNLAIGFNTVLD